MSVSFGDIRSALHSNGSSGLAMHMLRRLSSKGEHEKAWEYLRSFVSVEDVVGYTEWYSYGRGNPANRIKVGLHSPVAWSGCGWILYLSTGFEDVIDPVCDAKRRGVAVGCVTPSLVQGWFVEWVWPFLSLWLSGLPESVFNFKETPADSGLLDGGDSELFRSHIRRYDTWLEFDRLLLGLCYASSYEELVLLVTCLIKSSFPMIPGYIHWLDESFKVWVLNHYIPDLSHEGVL